MVCQAICQCILVTCIWCLMLIKVNNPNESADYEASHYHNLLHPSFPEMHMITPRLCVRVGLQAVKCLTLFETVES
jgi:hypothetical protein